MNNKIFHQKQTFLRLSHINNDFSSLIPDNCFNNCTTLTEITLPYTITHVGNRAFHDCWAIEKFDTQGRISSIEWNPSSIYYMSKDIVGEGYWDNLEDGVEEQLYYLNNHGVVVS